MQSTPVIFSRTGPSAQAIEQAIQSRISSPGWFQKLAELVAVQQYPSLSDRLVPFGRNLDEKPVPGWPDAYLALDEGGIIAIEASTERKALKSHWPKDIVKLKKNLAPDARGGLIWVAWENDPAAAQLDGMRKEAREAGLPPARTQIFFHKGLCNELTKPCYARLWRQLLDLPVDAAPFVWIDEAPIFGREDGQTIQPTLVEYEAGLVHAPKILSAVHSALRRNLGTLVVGHGSSGKTTLAILVSYAVDFVHGATYYLDLTGSTKDFSIQQAAEEAIAAFGDRSTLFVIDNAHLALGMAHRLVKFWQTANNGSYLLILSRKMQRLKRVWDIDTELENLGLPVHELMIQQEDLEGAYRRLKGRNSGQQRIATVPEPTLNQWQRLYGGDLIAFSAAVLQRIRDPSWNLELDPSDASNYVRDAYLNRLPPSEREALVQLSAVGEKEISLPIQTFQEDSFHESIARGIIWVETRGRLAEYQTYRLAHPGLGRLLLEAAGQSAQAPAIRRALLVDHPFSAFLAAHILANNGEHAEARELLAALWSAHEWPLENALLFWWKSSIGISIALGALAPQVVSRRFGDWIRKDLSFKALVSLALRTPLGDLATFLIYTAAALPEATNAIRRGLAEEKNHQTLVALALRTPLHFHVLFFTFAKAAMPEVSAALQTALENEKNQEGLIDLALHTTLSDLASFLNYARVAMPGVSVVIRRGLADKRSEKALAALALRTALDGLTSFLRFARSDDLLTDVRINLPASLMKGELRADLSQRFLKDGPEKIVAICREESSFELMLADIPLDTWSATWGKDDRGDPNWFIRFSQLASRAKRTDLIETIASNLVESSTRQQWQGHTITLRHLGYVLGSLRQCEEADILGFLERCIGNDWVDTRYRSPRAHLGALAGAVMSVAVHDSQRIRNYFRLPSLFDRLWQAYPTRSDDGEQVGLWLQFFGAVSLLGNPFNVPFLQPLEADPVISALRYYAPQPGVRSIGYIQSNLWVGLRELSRQSELQFTLEANVSEQILSQFKYAEPKQPRARWLNLLMVEWLERCEAMGWRLSVEKLPLHAMLDALEEKQPLSSTAGIDRS